MSHAIQPMDPNFPLQVFLLTFGTAFLIIGAALFIANPLPMGTRTVLYGFHAFWLHPWFVAAAWWKLFGFPWQPKLWVAFIVHDIGYWGKPNIDGPEGEAHTEVGARIMGRLFGDEWYWFTLLHSRTTAAEHGRAPSRLCYADKLAITFVPRWLFILLVRASGEWREAVAHPKYADNVPAFRLAAKLGKKHDAMCAHLRDWVGAQLAQLDQPPTRDEDDEHPDAGNPDLWESAEVRHGRRALTPDEVRRQLARPPRELSFSDLLTFCLGKPRGEASDQEISAATAMVGKLLMSEQPEETDSA